MEETHPERGHAKREYPSEVTFKVVCRSASFTEDILRTLVLEHNIDPVITHRESREGRFISYTITAVFASEEQLQALCAKIASIEGFVTMF